jgi:DNA helicase-2/ATP-dependent DNA helicase PcrA
VREVVRLAVPARAAERDRAEWMAIVDVVAALASSCASLEEFVAKIAAQSASLRDAPANAVVLSTIHSAKGLEWEAVFLVGMEQGVLPHASNDDVEEERRVAYVALTRAKRLLGLTYSHERFGQPARPSQFLQELAGFPRRCIWTDANAPNAGETLPLLSDRERERIAAGSLMAPAGTSDPLSSAKRSRKRARRHAAGQEKREPQPPSHKADALPPRHGTAWTAEEDMRLRSAFERGEAIATIASAHQRKVSAITSRLVRLGLITEDGVVVP